MYIANPDKALGGVYFISCGDAVKIGHTECISKRFHVIQTAHYKKLEILAIIKSINRFETEKKMHEKFKHLRINGEWFKLTPEIILFLYSPETEDPYDYFFCNTFSHINQELNRFDKYPNHCNRCIINKENKGYEFSRDFYDNCEINVAEHLKSINRHAVRKMLRKTTEILQQKLKNLKERELEEEEWDIN